MSNIHLRIIFGSIYVAVMVFSVLASSPYFEYLMAIFTFLSVRETAILANKKSTQQIWVVPIIFGFSNWLGKLWANRLMEKEKAVMWSTEFGHPS